MENTGISSRRNAKVVGYVDLTLIILQIVCVAIFAGVILYYIQEADNDTNNPDKNDDPIFQTAQLIKRCFSNWAITYFILIFLAIYAVRIWAAIMLIRSTKPGTLVYPAWKRASCWKWTTIVFIVIRLFGVLRSYDSGKDWGYFLICAGIDGIYLYFVLGYLKELDVRVSSSTTYHNFTDEEATPPSSKTEDSSSSKGYAQTGFIITTNNVDFSHPKV